MTDRTCLDVAADAVFKSMHIHDGMLHLDRTVIARAALDAIHPALAHLTPDDVAGIFDALDAYRQFRTFRPRHVPKHVWQVLRDVAR